MKKLLLSCLAFVSLLGASACGVEQAAPTVETADTAEAAQPDEAAVVGVWQAGPVEGCLDQLGLSCNASRPSPQCNTAVPGNACNSIGRHCYKVSGQTFRDMDCVSDDGE